MADFKALIFYFVAANYVVHFVSLEEVLGDVGSELASDASFRRGPASHVLRVAPKKLAHNSLLRGLPVALRLPDVIEGDAILAKVDEERWVIKLDKKLVRCFSSQ